MITNLEQMLTKRIVYGIIDHSKKTIYVGRTKKDLLTRLGQHLGTDKTVKKYIDKMFEYTPLQIKQALTGYGRADKKQMQQMTKMILGLDKVPKPDDTADALAVAICHSHYANYNMLSERLEEYK